MQTLLQAGLQQRQRLLLPSWCPDLSTYKPTPIFYEAKLMAKYQFTIYELPESLAKYSSLCQAGLQVLKTLLDGKSVVSNGPYSDAIILKAQIVDSISGLGPVRSGSFEDPTSMPNFPEYLEWDYETYSMVDSDTSKKQRYSNRSQRTAAYAHAIIADDRITHKQRSKTRREYTTASAQCYPSRTHWKRSTSPLIM